MNSLNTLTSQMCIDEGIGTHLLNACLLRQSCRYVQSRATARPATHKPRHTGDVLTDTIALGTAALIEYFQRVALAQPLKTVKDGPSQSRIRVCGAMDYVIDFAHRRVWSEPAPYTASERRNLDQALWLHDDDEGLYLEDIDLLNTLSRPKWLEYLARRPGWFCSPFVREAPGQEHLFVDECDLQQALQAITQAAYRRLQRDPLLQALRHQLASALLKHLGPHLMQLAMRARTEPGKASLIARHLNRVWKHQPTFECMQRENPRLLTLLTIWLDYRGTNYQPPTDAVPEMRLDLLTCGLPPRAWRYLAQHGPQRLVLDAAQKFRWSTLCTALGLLHKARWPTPPPRGFMRLLYDTAGMPDTFDDSSTGVPGWFWQVACQAAHDCQGDTLAYQALFNNIGPWAWLVRQHQPRPDSNQKRRGLRWLQAWTAQYESLALLEDRPVWGEWLQPVQWERVTEMHVVPLQSPRAVLQEAQALHNCADSFTDRCEQSKCMLFSLRDPSNGRRVALMSMECRSEGRSWTLGQIAGPCNRPVAGWVHRAALQVAGLVRQCHRLRLAATEQAPNDDSRICPALSSSITSGIS